MKDTVLNPPGHREIISTNPSKIFPTDLWDSLANYSLPHMRGREGFENHAWTAINLAFQVASAARQESVVNEDVTSQLVVLAFLHDLGYSQVDSGIYNQNQSRISVSAKLEHQEKSALLALKYIRENHDVVSQYFNQDQQAQLVQMIGSHDSLDEYIKFSPPNQILLRLFNEVDSLAAIDMMFGKPSFNKNKLVDWMNDGPIKKRVPFFLTDFSKDKYAQLALELTQYANNPNPSL